MNDWSTAVHRICWLRQSGETIVATGCRHEDDLFTAAQLPDGAWELHWCGNEIAAASFVIGVQAVGSNAVSAFQGVEGAGSIVLLHRADHDRNPGNSLDESVTLHLHADMNARKANVRWAGVRASLRTMYKNEAQTVKPIRIGETDEQSMQLRVCYPFWNGQTHGGRLGGDNYISVIDKGGVDYLELPLSRYPECAKAGDGYVDAMRRTAAASGWNFDGENFSIPIDEAGIAPTLDRLGDTFHAMWAIEWDATKVNNINTIRNHSENKRIINALRKGGVLSNGKKKILKHAGGKEETISWSRITDMEAAGMIHEEGRNYVETPPLVETLLIATAPEV